tara:strand:+ start:967 stop:1470 length:504 start_codon:yes stop_codon:yes gene_type:complete
MAGPIQEAEIQGRLISILKTGETKYGKTWACVCIESMNGHTEVALVPDETFPVSELPHWEGLVLNLQIREKFKLRVAPLSHQPADSRQEAFARQRGEETVTSGPVTQDHPLDGMTEFKLHQLQAQDEMLNGQHWRLADDVMRLDNRVGVLEALVNERGDLVIDGGEY